MKTFVALGKWAQRPHWTWQAAGLLWFAAAVFVWSVTIKLFRPYLPAGVILALGVFLPPACVAVWFVVKAIGWVEGRVRVTVEAGVPLSLPRIVGDLRTERKKFVESDTLWERAVRGQNLRYGGQELKLNRHQLNATGDVKAHINPAKLGGDLDQVTRLAASGTLAGIMQCQEVSVQPTSKHGQAWVTFYKTPPFSRSFTLSDLPQSGKGQISFGIEESSVVAAVRYGLSILVAGATGAGKSILFKNMMADILRDGQPTEMYFVDPKKAEFRQFKDKVGQRIRNVKIAGYCTTGAEAVAMFQAFTDEMHERQERMAQMGLTEITNPTEDFPVRIIVIDELLDVIPSFPKTGSPMRIAISQGRATLDSVVGMVQMAKIATLGDDRDLFPLRACMRTMTAENTKAVLGISEGDGAPCSRIPLSMPGVGYYITEQGVVRKFRTAKVTDNQWSGLIDGQLPEGMPVNVEHSGPPGYTYIGYDRNGKCMYVGKAAGWTVGLRTPVERRRGQHRRYDRTWCAEHEQVENWWTKHVVDSRLVVQKYPSEAAALIAEERLIKELKPRFNIKHNGGNPLSNLNMTKRAGMKRRLADAAREYVELGREVQAVREVKAGFAKQERVQRHVEKHERFVETVTAGSMR